MNFKELQDKISEFVYSEDQGMARIVIASIVATRMRLGNPIWIVVIGQSSGGKSQLLRPLALTDTKFIHRVDDLTESTLLSGAKVGQGGGEVSLLKRIGSHGIMVISDLTVLFSKNSESRAAILSQFRMLYDGEMIKAVGNAGKPVTWKGELGVLAGCTPSLYGFFEEAADMGERFIYYRMKPYDVEKATRLSMGRKMYGRELDEKLSDMYSDYIKDCVKGLAGKELDPISAVLNERILQIAMFAAKLRTPAKVDKWSHQVTHIPVSEAPMRVALQLTALARGLAVMNQQDSGTQELCEQDIQHIEYCAYSLASEEKRACLRVLAGLAFESAMSTSSVADPIGLNTDIIRTHLQHLAAIGVLERSGGGEMLAWRFKTLSDWTIVRRLEGIFENTLFTSRVATSEEVSEQDDIALAEWAHL